MEMRIGSIRFRQVTVADAPMFFELRRAAILVGCAGHYPAALLDTWIDPATDGGLAEPTPEHFYFAEIDGRVVGSGVLDLASGRIDAVFVHPTAFRRGIGAAIMRQLEQIARANGLRRLVLDATLNAVEFYRSMGFEGHARGTYASPRGLSLACIPMTKTLR
jgi:GNAT superfamily N-acetyltransferase